MTPADQPLFSGIPPRKVRRRVPLVWVSLLCSVLVLTGDQTVGSPPGEPPEATVFFFSPETNINNYSALKSEFDSYFSSFGKLKFQPFSDRAVFEKFLAERPAGLFLMSSWHFKQLRDKTAWNPVLVGVLKNKTTQKHLLYARKNIAEAALLRGATIATAGTREYTLTLLHQILGAEARDLIASFKLLVVPKDIDALMAVSFGMASAAVATESGAERLSRTNPKQLSSLRLLQTGSESLLPVLVAPLKANARTRELITVLGGMGAVFFMAGTTVAMAEIGRAHV